jgi:hypothetical protein
MLNRAVPGALKDMKLFEDAILLAKINTVYSTGV